MKLKKANYFFGTSMILIGGIRGISIILGTLLALTSNSLAQVVSFVNGTVCLYQLIIAIGSIVMIFLNLKYNPKIAGGYLLELFALGIELIMPSLLLFVYVWFELVMYLKAGTMVREKDFDFFSSNEKNNKKKVEETNWFFENK